MLNYEQAYKVLYEIYNKYRVMYRENYYDSKQMCLMWSTKNPPDEVERTDPFIDIEEVFYISISDDDALDLYDLSLEEATKKILKLQENQ